MSSELEKREPDDREYDFPFDRIALSEPAREILERFWYQISQRRPFKHDFPDMYEKAPYEFDRMFEDIGNAIDTVIKEALAVHDLSKGLRVETAKIAERTFARLISGQFVDLKALFGVAAQDGAEAALRWKAAQDE